MRTKIKGIDIELKSTFYEKKAPKEGVEPKPVKAHQIVGFGKIIIGEIIEINVSIFLNTKENLFWIAMPSKKVGAKYISTAFGAKEHMQILNDLLNNKKMEPQFVDEPFEIEGI